MKQFLLRGALALVGIVLVTLVASVVKWPMVTQVDTASAQGYPELVGRYYELEAAAVMEAVEAFAEEQEAWTVVKASAKEGEMVLERNSLWGYWDARVELRVDTVVTGVSEVQGASAIERGWSDFGQNARVIRELWAGLDERLKGYRLQRGAPPKDENGEQKVPADA